MLKEFVSVLTGSHPPEVALVALLDQVGCSATDEGEVRSQERRSEEEMSELIRDAPSTVWAWQQRRKPLSQGRALCFRLNIVPE